MTSLMRSVLRRPRAVLIVTAVLLALAGWRITRLQLSTDFSELLPASDPAVVVLKQMNQLPDAANALREAIRLQPDFAGAHTVAGWLTSPGAGEPVSVTSYWNVSSPVAPGFGV